MTGILIKLNDRPDIIFENGLSTVDYIVGNACLFLKKCRWVLVRLEFTDDWVLVDDAGQNILVPYGDRVML